MNINLKNLQTIQHFIVTVVVVIILIVIGHKVWYVIKHEETDNAQVEMRLIPILPRISGYVSKIYVDDYAKVKKGELLLVIDSSELQLQLKEMQADYVQAISDIENAKASLTNAEASLLSSKTSLEVMALRKEKALNDFNRDKNLFEKNAITQKQLDESRSNYEINAKQLELGHREVQVNSSHISILYTQLAKAQAVLEIKNAHIEQQKLKLSYCRIFATSDGVVSKRNVDVGQFIQAGTPLFSLVDNKPVWVVANFKESQIQNINIGQQVDLKMDGFPAIPIKGKVISISEATGARYSLLPPDNATGNFVKVAQRIPVKIEIKDVEKYKDILRAGISLTVSIPKSL